MSESLPNRELNELAFLIFQSLDGSISRDDVERMETILRSSPPMRAAYREYLSIYCELTSLLRGAQVNPSDINRPEESELWKAMAEYEKTAPEIVIPQAKPKKELIQKVEYPPLRRRKLSKWEMGFLATAAAMLMFVILFARFVSRRGVEVATLTNGLNARWVGAPVSMEFGARLTTGSDLWMLQEGIAELTFDNGSRVVMEAPCEFSILTSDQILLNYGRLYAAVPKGAIGFTVNTPSARIIDLGTEFGIHAETGGDTSLHVIKGKTTLIAGQKMKKISMEVASNTAKRVSSANRQIVDIPYNETLFARQVDGRRRFVWRGENLNLASIVAGRDGFQEVGSLSGLNPTNGKYTSSVIGKDREANPTYNRVADSAFIDGVFVPDGGSGPIQITSLGHTFDCPDTFGIFTHEIAAYKGDIKDQATTIPPVIIHGQTFPNESIVLLHSNIGVTFDLQAIRQSLPNLELKSFKAWGGLTEALAYLKKDRPDIDFWVLVDGQIKYERKMLQIEDGPVSFEIELHPQNRFLTLIVTEGVRGADNNRIYPYANDFFYLINPELTLKEKPER